MMRLPGLEVAPDYDPVEVQLVVVVAALEEARAAMQDSLSDSSVMRQTIDDWLNRDEEDLP